MYCIIYDNTTDRVIMVLDYTTLDTANDNILDDRGWGLKGIKSKVSYGTKDWIEDTKYLDPEYFESNEVYVNPSDMTLSE